MQMVLRARPISTSRRSRRPPLCWRRGWVARGGAMRVSSRSPGRSRMSAIGCWCRTCRTSRRSASRRATASSSPTPSATSSRGRTIRAVSPSLPSRMPPARRCSRPSSRISRRASARSRRSAAITTRAASSRSSPPGIFANRARQRGSAACPTPTANGSSCSRMRSASSMHGTAPRSRRWHGASSRTSTRASTISVSRSARRARPCSICFQTAIRIVYRR